MKHMVTKKWWLLPLLVVVVLGVSVYYWQQLEAHDDTIRISGNIETTEVQVSFKRAGQVTSRLVSEGQFVQAQAVVAHLDRTDLEQEVAMRRAEVALTAARLAELEAGSRPEEITRALAAVEQTRARLDELLAGARTREIAAARAQLQRAEAEKQRAEQDYARQRQLHDEDVISTRELDNARSSYRTAEAMSKEAHERLMLVEEGPRLEQIAHARAALSEAEAWHEQVVSGPRTETIEQVRAEKGRAEGALRLADTHLSHTTITAPISGIVLSEHVESGEYVAPGSPVVTLGNLERVWLRGYISGTELGRVKLGQSVAVTTDTFPDKVYEGTLTFIASEAEFTPKHVQTEKERVKLVYRVKVDIPNPEFELKPGMPADAVIHTDERVQS